MSPTTFVPAPWTSPQGVWSVLVAGPTEEPLTLDEAKLRAGLDWIAGDPRDAMLEDFIRAARAQVEHDTGLALLTQTWDIHFAADLWPVVPLPMQAQPVQSIAPIAEVLLQPADVAALEASGGSDRYAVTRAAPRRSPWAYRPGVHQTVVVPEGTTGVRVVAGWPSAAALRLEAPSLHHAVALLTAHYATAGRDLVGDTIDQMPFGYEDAIASHRLVWVI